MPATANRELSGAPASATAGALLASMAGIRRSLRLAGRPPGFSDLTRAQLDLVLLVRSRPGVSVADAAEELRLAANTVSTLVRQLTRSGFLVRGVDKADRRVARLELTPDTAQKVSRFRDRRAALLTSAIEALPPGDRECLEAATAVLEALAAALPELVEAK
jgi:DNA-binding MarR family transcriptional regulator